MSEKAIGSKPADESPAILVVPFNPLSMATSFPDGYRGALRSVQDQFCGIGPGDPPGAIAIFQRQ